ncbi:MAG: succinylglutamate desuccinylase/aspartoacylase family protein [Marinobacter sp.]|uniref:succinylglutamate desuccinylase/aspartoacylase family protein n=1 Tax=Marinobacter sp. TaxID=50741 RepID=UPI0034A00103
MLLLVSSPVFAEPAKVPVSSLAEDESVEEIETSAPRQPQEVDRDTTGKSSGNTGTKTEARPPQEEPSKARAADPEKIVAPDIDLKEVAPVPEPVESAPQENVADDAPGAERNPYPIASGQDNAAPPATEVQDTTSEEAGAKTEIPVEAKPFSLLNADVLPGTSTRLAWSPGIQIAGLSQPTPVLVVNGAKPGPALCLTGAVHGDELNGIEIVRRVMYDLEPEKLSGTVVGLPIVNVQGFQQGSRYLADRRDLNRYFPGDPAGSLAGRIAHSLFEQVIRHCDMLVDIHTGSLKRTNLPQMRADMNNPAVAEFTRGFDGMAIVHSSGGPGMLRSAAVAAGIVSVTMEAGESLRIQEDQIEAGVNSINSLMEKQKMLNRFFVWGDPEPVYYDSHWLRADHGGILFSDVKLGATVIQGEILGIVADPITNEQHPIRADSDGRVIGMAVDQVVMAGFAAYHIGLKAEVPGE